MQWKTYTVLAAGGGIAGTGSHSIKTPNRTLGDTGIVAHLLVRYIAVDISNVVVVAVIVVIALLVQHLLGPRSFAVDVSHLSPSRPTLQLRR